MTIYDMEICLFAYMQSEIELLEKGLISSKILVFLKVLEIFQKISAGGVRKRHIKATFI